MSVRRSVRTVLAALLAGVLAPALAAAPARADVPPLELQVLVDIGSFPVQDPFVGEIAIVQSQSLQVGDRTGWTCTVDFGDGTSGPGYWRAKPGTGFAPCAASHTYATAGTYTVRLTVSDPSGDVEAVSRVLHVGPRPVTAVDGGLEGSTTTLRAPAQAHWQNPDRDRCALSATDAVQVTLRCVDEGTYLVPYDTGTTATSGGYAVTYANGAPRPTVTVTRDTLDGPVPSPRVGTGDELLVVVDAGDPSWSGGDGFPMGDQITCRLDYGDGRRETVEGVSGRCYGHVDYLSAGPRRIQVTVRDDSGATATRRTSVRVIRRDLRVGVTGTLTEGTRAEVTGSLTAGVLSGTMRFRTPAGERVTVSRLTRIGAYLDGEVALEGRARLNGDPGYRVQASILRDGATAFRATLTYVGDPGPPIAVVEGLRSDLRVVYSAPVVR